MILCDLQGQSERSMQILPGSFSLEPLALEPKSHFAGETTSEATERQGCPSSTNCLSLPSLGTRHVSEGDIWTVPDQLLPVRDTCVRNTSWVQSTFGPRR